MKKFTILVDMDSTLVDLSTKWYGDYNQETGESLTLDQVTDWNTGKFVRNPRHLFSILRRPGFFFDLEPLPGALEAVRTLLDHEHHVVIASLPSGPDSARDKMLWLKKHLPEIPENDVMLGGHKIKLHADVFVDDAPHYIADYKKKWPDAFVTGIAHPYNEPVSHVSDAPFKADLLAPSYKDPAGAWRIILKAIKLRGLQRWVAEAPQNRLTGRS